MRLHRATFALASRRLTRSLGYRGDNPRWVFAVGTLTLVVLDALVTTALVARLGHIDAGAELMQALLPTTTLLLTYALAGPVLLLAESARGRDSSLQRVLESLPLRPTTVRLHLVLPPLAITALVIGLIVPPAMGALVMAGVPVTAALLAVLSTVGVATSTVAVCLSLTKLVLPGARWATVHYPVALLGFMAAITAILMSVVELDPTVTPTERVLVFPLILAEVQQTGSFSTVMGITTIGWSLVVSAVALGISTRSANTERGNDPVVRWRLSDRAHLVWGDLAYLLRSPSLVSNFVAVLFLDVGLVAVLFRIGPSTAVRLVNPLIALMPLMAGIVVRMTRGLFRLVNPPHQIAGVPLRSWVWHLNVCGIIVFLAAMSPALAVLWRRELAAAVDAAPLAVATLGCLAVSLLLSWWLPGTTDDPASQVVSAAVYLTGASLVTWAVQWVADWNAPIAVACAAALVAAALASGHMAERGRWQPDNTRQDVTSTSEESQET